MVDPDQFSLPDNFMIDSMKLMIYSNGFLWISNGLRVFIVKDYSFV